MSATAEIAAPLSITSASLKSLGLRGDMINYALKFKATKQKQTGLLAKFKKSDIDMDLDIACLLFDNRCNLIDKIWFKQLRDATEAIRHHGDSINGKDRGEKALFEGALDPEIISMRMAQIPKHATHIALTLSSYYGQPINHIEAGAIKLADDEGNKAFDIDLKTLEDNCTGLWVAHLRKEVDDWHLTAQLLNTQNHHLPKMADFISKELARSLPALTTMDDGKLIKNRW